MECDIYSMNNFAIMWYIHTHTQNINMKQKNMFLGGGYPYPSWSDFVYICRDKWHRRLLFLWKYNRKEEVKAWVWLCIMCHFNLAQVNLSVIEFSEWDVSFLLISKYLCFQHNHSLFTQTQFSTFLDEHYGIKWR